MMKWRKKGEPTPLPVDRNKRNDALESRVGLFRSVGDFALPTTTTTNNNTNNSRADKDASTDQDSPKAITKDGGSPSTAPGVYETVPIVVNRKRSTSAPGGVERREEVAVSTLSTFRGDGSAGVMSDSYGTTLGDREFSIYESSPAFRLEPISASKGITSASTDGSNKTTITINSDPTTRLNGSTTLVINHDPDTRLNVPVHNSDPKGDGTTTLLINSEPDVRLDSSVAPVERLDKTCSTHDLNSEPGARLEQENSVDKRLKLTPLVPPLSVSPLSRASSHRTSDTEHSSGTGSTYYLTGGVGSPFTPLGSTTKLITQGRVKDKFKTDTGWLPAWGTIFTVLSLVVGFGNIVRLPRVVFLHGGGPFLVVYVAIMLVVGIPLVFLEIGLGQFCEQGATKLWRAVPLFTGVGYVKILSSVLLAIYYPVLMTISLFYMIWSAKGLPFPECIHTFIGDVAYNHTTSGEECLHNTFLRPPKDDGMWFGVNVALMFLIWAIIMICLSKNRKSFRIATYVIVVPIILILVALLVENIVRDPAARGIDKLFTFDWTILLDIEVWYFATIQMFFSTHLGFGNIVTSGGRLYPQTNAFWTATMFVFANLSLGIISVLVTYYYIGELDVDVTTIKLPEVFTFTLLYDAATRIITPHGEVWAACGYLAFACSGLAAMLTLVITILEVMEMELNKKLRWQWWQKTCVVCAAGFLLGIPSLLPYELELVHILDHYVIGRMVIASTILELIGIAWIYGCSTLYTDFEFILGYRLNPMWKFVWWIAPVLFLVVEIWSLVSLPLTGLYEENGDEIWVFATGWTLYLISWLIVIVAAVHQVSKQIDYNLSARILSTLKPSRKWGPVDTMYRHNWHQWRNQSTVPGERDYTLKRRGTKDYTHTLKRTRSPQGMHFQTTLSPANTIRSNRGVDKPPYTIQDNDGHVCWRGNADNVDQSQYSSHHIDQSQTDAHHIEYTGDYKT